MKHRTELQTDFVLNNLENISSKKIFSFVPDFKYCPTPVDEGECPLAKRVNECCSNTDCRFGQICCSEPCGNACRVRVDSPEGIEAEVDSECKLGEIEKKKWYQKIFGRIEKNEEALEDLKQ